MNTMSKLLITIFILFSGSLFAHREISEQSYNLDFLAAKFIDTAKSNETILVFKYQPKFNKEYKLILSMRIRYSIGDSDSSNIRLLGNQENTIAIYGRDVDQENPQLYSMIKDKIVLDQKE